MAWGFRKSIKIGPGVRLNTGKRGIGVSAGPRGAKASANTSGRRGFGLSLAGLFWRRNRR